MLKQSVKDILNDVISVFVPVSFTYISYYDFPLTFEFSHNLSDNITVVWAIQPKRISEVTKLKIPSSQFFRFVQNAGSQTLNYIIVSFYPFVCLPNIMLERACLDFGI